jgi:hypothetical membrane protein
VCPPVFRQVTVWALYAAIAMPLIYFGTQLIAAPFYPGYSFAQDTASMLGTTTSCQPWIFNLGAVLTGVAGLTGAFGLVRALRTVTSTALALLVGLSVVANGVLSLKAGMFPMPDPRHASWQFLMFPTLAAPVLLLIALWRQSMALRMYLLCNAVVLLLMMPMMMHRMAPCLRKGRCSGYLRSWCLCRSEWQDMRWSGESGASGKVDNRTRARLPALNDEVCFAAVSTSSIPPKP